MDRLVLVPFNRLSLIAVLMATLPGGPLSTAAPPMLNNVSLANSSIGYAPAGVDHVDAEPGHRHGLTGELRPQRLVTMRVGRGGAS